MVDGELMRRERIQKRSGRTVRCARFSYTSGLNYLAIRSWVSLVAIVLKAPTI